MKETTNPSEKDIKVLVKFIETYCSSQHEGREEFALPPHGGLLRESVALCSDCRELLAYALEKRRKCPLDPKPSCKHCHIHCYSKENRARIRQIMAYSGRKLMLRGRIDYLWHYFF